MMVEDQKSIKIKTLFFIEKEWIYNYLLGKSYT